MRITIERVENGFLVIYETDKGRKVFIVDTVANVLQFVKDILDPSPVAVLPEKKLAMPA